MNDSRIREAVEAAANVAKVGAQALSRLEGVARSAEFEKALRILLGCEGVVYLIGMGKSGLVGQKIAATLTSVGAPASYIHAGDALHGDLGAIRPADAVILISKSGETREILQTMRFLKSQNNPTIGITNNVSSSLGTDSDVALPMLVEAEGCPLNLAPMTSSTATMAIGDALAAALIVARDFQPETFAKYHPGGRLGRMLTASVADMLGQNSNPAVSETQTLREAVVKLVDHRLGGVSVVDGAGKLSGVVTDGDMKRIMLSGDNSPLDRPVTEVMAKNPTVIRLEASAAEAIDIMEKGERQISILPVVDGDGKPVGILRLHDVIRTHL